MVYTLYLSIYVNIFVIVFNYRFPPMLELGGSFYFFKLIKMLNYKECLSSELFICVRGESYVH